MLQPNSKTTLEEDLHDPTRALLTLVAFEG